MPPNALPRDDIGRMLADILRRLEQLERKISTPVVMDNNDWFRYVIYGDDPY